MRVITPRRAASSSMASPSLFDPVMPAKPISSLKGQGSAPTTYSIDPRHQLGVHILRVQLQHPLLVVLGLGGQAKARPVAALHHRDVGALQAAHPAAGIKSVDVAGVAANPPIGLADRLVGQPQNAVARLRIFLGGVAAGQKTVICVEGRVQQVQPVKLLKDHGIQQQRRGLRIARMRRMKALEALHRAGIIQIVKVLVGLAHQRIAIQRVGVRLGGPAEVCRRKERENAEKHPAGNALQSQFTLRFQNTLHAAGSILVERVSTAEYSNECGQATPCPFSESRS